MATRFTITIDDDAQGERPDQPYTATVLRRSGARSYVVGVGLGATARQAVANIPWPEVHYNEHYNKEVAP